MDNNLILLISFAFSLVVYGLIAKWYIAPRLKAMPREAALTPFLLFHAFRYVGLIFLVPGVVSPTLPGAFANPAAYGDLAAAILALIALGFLRAGSVLALPLVWVFNIEGTLDLLYAVFQGTRLGVIAQLGPAFFIPTVIVPALLVSHVLVFRILLRRD